MLLLHPPFPADTKAPRTENEIPQNEVQHPKKALEALHMLYALQGGTETLLFPKQDQLLGTVVYFNQPRTERFTLNIFSWFLTTDPVLVYIHSKNTLGEESRRQKTLNPVKKLWVFLGSAGISHFSL